MGVWQFAPVKMEPRCESRVEAALHPLPKVVLRPAAASTLRKRLLLQPETTPKVEEEKKEVEEDQPQDLSLKRRDQECQTERLCCDTARGGRRLPTKSETLNQIGEDDKDSGGDSAPLSRPDSVSLNQLYLGTIYHMILRTRELFKRTSGSDVYPKLPRSLDDLFRSPQGYPEGLLRNASLHNPSAAANDSFPQGASGGADELGFGQSAANLTANSTTQTAAEEQQSVDSFLGLHSTTDSEIIKDIISVLGGRDLHETENASLWGRNSGSHHASHHLHNNNVDEERAVNVTDFSPDESHHGFAGFHSSAQNAAAAAPIALALPPGYAGYHPYMSVAAAAVRSSQQYTPLTNHTYAAAASNAMSLQQQMDDLETASYTSGKSNRSKDFSFDSDSIKQDPDGCAAERLRQSRDERKAREIGIQFSIHDIINLPMDEFNDMLSRHELNEEQLNMCRDIRRRGKNKVAAQNCRKRKIDQIAHLEVQVNEARARKRQLLDERQQLYRQREEWRNKLSIIEEDVLLGMNKNGKEFALDLSSSDVRIVRRQVPAQGAATSANSSERIDPRFQTLTSTSYHGRYVWKGSSSGGGNS